MPRKSLNGVSKTFHLRVTSTTDPDLFRFIETQMEAGKTFRDIVSLLYGAYSDGLIGGADFNKEDLVDEVKELVIGSLGDVSNVVNSDSTDVVASCKCKGTVGVDSVFDSNFKIVLGV